MDIYGLPPGITLSQALSHQEICGPLGGIPGRHGVRLEHRFWMEVALPGQQPAQGVPVHLTHNLSAPFFCVYPLVMGES